MLAIFINNGPLIWVNYNDRTLFSLTIIIVSKGNHPQMAALFRLVKYYNLPRYTYIIYIHIWMYIYIEYITNSIRSISFLINKILWNLWWYEATRGRDGIFKHSMAIRAIAMVKLHFMKPFLGDEGNPFLAWYGWPSTPTKNDVLTMALRMGQKYRGLCFHQVRGFFTRLKSCFSRWYRSGVQNGVLKISRFTLGI